MPAERQIITMLERVRPLLGAHPLIFFDYLYYRSEIEFQRNMLDQAELKALNRFDRLLLKHRAWIVNVVYSDPEPLAEAREQFEPEHWWWYLDRGDINSQYRPGESADEHGRLLPDS